jgi:superfamily II DNA or RNA helicase/tetratricopeptide (TPR) repeat protein
MTVQPRYYQEECCDAVWKNLGEEKTRNLCVEPTGSGKSVIMALLARKILAAHPGKKILYVSHRKELDRQNAAAFLEINPTGSAGFERAQQVCSPDKTAMFASIATVGKEGIPRIRRWASPKDIAAVFFDEAHHITARTYRLLLEELQRANPEIAVVGFTATPERLDGEQLDELLPHLAHETSVEELVEAQYLAPIVGVSVSTNSSLDGMKKRRGDFSEEELADRINNDERNALAAKIYKENHQGDLALVFAVNKAHANAVTTAFSLQGIRARTITEESPPEERDRIKEDMRSGRVDVAVSVGCLTEGFDLPETKVIFALRPTKSPTFMLQMLGRGMRFVWDKEENKADLEAKKHCTIYDFVDLGARENGARSCAAILGLPEEANIDLKGENISVIKAMVDLVTLDPLAAANLAKAKTPAELRKLLTPVDILSRIRNRQPLKGSNLPWTPGACGSHFLQLGQGELVRLGRDARGVFVLEHETIDIRRRELQRNPNWQGTGAGRLEATRTELRANSLKEALEQAENELGPVLHFDWNLLSSKASWKIAAAKERATPRQQEAIRKTHILDPEEVGRLSKLEANQILSWLMLKRETLRASGKCPDGRYEGADAVMVAIHDPEYLKRMLSQGRAEVWKATELFNKALQTNPAQWLEKNFRGLYKRFGQPMRAELDAWWNAGERTKALEKVAEILRNDPSRTWETIQTVAKERTEVLRIRMEKYRGPKATEKSAPQRSEASDQRPKKEIAQAKGWTYQAKSYAARALHAPRPAQEATEYPSI